MFGAQSRVATPFVATSVPVAPSPEREGLCHVFVDQLSRFYQHCGAVLIDIEEGRVSRCDLDRTFAENGRCYADMGVVLDRFRDHLRKHPALRGSWLATYEHYHRRFVVLGDWDADLDERFGHSKVSSANLEIVGDACAVSAALSLGYVTV
jgi:hypothetical protein